MVRVHVGLLLSGGGGAGERGAPLGLGTRLASLVGLRGLSAWACGGRACGLG
jgi:hypothetical protein